MAGNLSAERPLFFDLSDRANFQLRGADRLRFLNGQITNDLGKATGTEAIEACVVSAKGKIDAHLFIVNETDAYLLDADTELRTALPARLDRYIIADDVQIEDVTGQFALFHLLCADRDHLPNEWKTVHARRFLEKGWDIWVKSDERQRVQEFLEQHATLCDPVCAETLRIESGLPRWGSELTAEIIPVEANLEERCIDYGKGCYIGQEVISRMKMSGQTNKRLCGLASVDGSPLQIGMRLHSPDDSRDVGWVTSAAYSKRLKKNIALGFVKRGFNERSTRLQTPAGPVIEVVPLPFT